MRRDELKRALEYRYTKSVENYHVWNYYKSGINSSLYIRKWRAIEPQNSYKIKVTLGTTEEFEDEINYSEIDIINNPRLKVEPIIINVEYYEEKTQTVRFRPISNIKPFDSIYIPKFIFRESQDSHILQVRIDWNSAIN